MKKYFIIAALILVIILIVVFRNQITTFFSKPSGAPSLPAAPPVSTGANGSGNTSTAPVLDYNLMLQLGSNNNETKKLQQWLGITADGIFGNQTKAALEAQKCVSEIRLSEWASTTCPVWTSGNTGTDPGAGASFDWNSWVVGFFS